LGLPNFLHTLLITSFTLEQISIWFTHILFYCEYPCHHYNQLAKFFVAVIHIIECAIANCEKKFTPYLPRISMNVGWKVPMMLLQNIEKNNCSRPMVFFAMLLVLLESPQ
jgi:hypothetical protein